jgi:hypothetical protein
MTPSLRAAALAAVAAVSLLTPATTAAAPAMPTQRSAECYDSVHVGRQEAWAWCNRLAYGEEVRVVARCGNGKPAYGPWVGRNGEYSFVHCADITDSSHETRIWT